MSSNKHWGRSLAEQGKPTLADDVDDAIAAVRAAVEAGDRPQIVATLAELGRLGVRHDRVMKNRHGDGRGRSRAKLVGYLTRSHAILEAGALGWAALPGPDSARNAAEIRRQLEPLAEMIRREENGGAEENRP